MEKKYDFSGWATRANLRCADGRTIMKGAFKHNDGARVPLVWNHQHNDSFNILGYAVLENRDEGVYTYGSFNDSEQGQNAKRLVQHGDIVSLSIFANELKQQGNNVIHGAIKEVSLVLAGANPGAFIDAIMAHSDEEGESAIIFSGDESLSFHEEDVAGAVDNELSHADKSSEEEKKVAEDKKLEEKKTETKDEKEETVADVFNTLNEKQKTVVYAMIGQALEESGNSDDDDDEGGDNNMKHNLFDQESTQENVLMHSDQEKILTMAKSNSVGSLQAAISIFSEQNGDVLAHGIDEIETLFPEYKDVRPGAPEFMERDQTWVSTVMQKVHKSPISRIRTRQADITGSDLRANGYEKGKFKNVSGNIKLLKRTTDPQTVYRKDALNRDDIIDITDFDVVEYQYQVMKQNMNEELATAFMIGDGREDGDEYKIDETHIRSIWHDDELYAIHTDVDIDSVREELNGTDTGAHFGDNYIYAEAIIQSALYARENYKGSGNLDFYCTPHLLNVMLLARDVNGRRIYSSKADLAAALNVNGIQTAEQFENRVRSVTVNGSVHTKKLLGIFVNLNDYQVGSTKGGEITRFNQFDIDFNQEKYLIETRLSAALTRVKSAIVLEEDVTE